jgi:hypothetical protein
MKEEKFTQRERIASEIAYQMTHDLTLEELIEMVSNYFYEEILNWDEDDFYDSAKESYPEIVEKYI